MALASLLLLSTSTLACQLIDPASIDATEAERDIFDQMSSVPEWLNAQAQHTTLSGRTLTVSSQKDIQLADGEVILTFDDGPGKQITERILTILQTYKVHATFFMVGNMVDSNPAAARLVAQQGNSVGSHTYCHPDLATIEHQNALTEIKQAEASIIRTTNLAAVAFFRFPFLSTTPELQQDLDRRGVIVIPADIDTEDYKDVPPAEIVDLAMKQLESKRKGIILMHDIFHRSVDALPLLLTKLNNSKFKVVNLQPSTALIGRLSHTP